MQCSCQRRAAAWAQVLSMWVVSAATGRPYPIVRAARVAYISAATTFTLQSVTFATVVEHYALFKITIKILNYLLRTVFAAFDIKRLPATSVWSLFSIAQIASPSSSNVGIRTGKVCINDDVSLRIVVYSSFFIFYFFVFLQFLLSCNYEETLSCYIASYQQSVAKLINTAFVELRV